MTSLHSGFKTMDDNSIYQLDRKYSNWECEIRLEGQIAYHTVIQNNSLSVIKTQMLYSFFVCPIELLNFYRQTCIVMLRMNSHVM